MVRGFTRFSIVAALAAGCGSAAAGSPALNPKPPIAVAIARPCMEAVQVARSPEARAAVGTCRAAAEAGSATAAYKLCEVLKENPDLTDARGWIFWCERAAAKDHPIAQFLLGLHYGTGDESRTRDLMIKAACAGYPPAQELLRAATGSETGGNRCAQPDSLDGFWEGTLAITARQNDRSPRQDPVVTRLTLDGDAARVRVLVRGTWEDVKPGFFQVRRHQASAVIHAINNGWDDDGNWIETWVFSVTLVDHDHLRAVYHRVVNNVHVDRQDDQAVWWYMAAGDLKRATTEPRP
jgi:hypothetical protein